MHANYHMRMDVNTDELSTLHMAFTTSDVHYERQVTYIKKTDN